MKTINKAFMMICVIMIIVPSIAMAGGTEETGASGDEPLQLRGMANQYKYAPRKDGEFWQTMEERYDVDYTVDWVPADSYNQKVDIVLASGDLPDIMQIQRLTRPSVLTALKAGAFTNLSPYLGDFSEYPNLGNLNPTAWQFSKVDGDNYIVPRTRGNLDSALFIRGDWLDELGLETPTTLDEYMNYLDLVTNSDLDGNGRIDTVGLVQSKGYFPAAFGTREPVYTDDGGIIHQVLTDNWADYVEWFRDAYANGYVAREYALISGSEQEVIFLSGQSATFTKNGWHKFRIEQELRKTDPVARVELLPYLDGPNGFAHIYDLGYFGGQVVSSEVPTAKVGRILEFFDATASEDSYNFVNFGVEGVHWTLVDGFPALTEQGQQEVTASFNAPFIFATAEYAKIDSPLAPVDYNLQTREEMRVLYDRPSKADMYNVLQSDAWTLFWSKIGDEFAAWETDAVTGKITMAEFREYQAQLRQRPDVVESYGEFARSYEQVYGD